MDTILEDSKDEDSIKNYQEHVDAYIPAKINKSRLKFNFDIENSMPKKSNSVNVSATNSPINNENQHIS